MGYIEEWEKDCVIDRNRLTEETLKSPNYHQKYLVMLMEAKRKKLKFDKELKDLKYYKFLWYKGRLGQQELEARDWKQYQGLKPSSGEMTFLLENDPAISEIQAKIDYIKNIMQDLESILLQVKQRDWAIKAFIEWSKFQAGG